jgi:hypothetical protein
MGCVQVDTDSNDAVIHPTLESAGANSRRPQTDPPAGRMHGAAGGRRDALLLVVQSRGARYGGMAIERCLGGSMTM